MSRIQSRHRSHAAMRDYARAVNAQTRAVPSTPDGVAPESGHPRNADAGTGPRGVVVPSSEARAGGDPEPSPGLRRRLRASALVPAALSVTCPEHGAAVGVACFGTAGTNGSGVCAERIKRRVRTRGR